MRTQQDTIAAIATPAGSGGVGIIRISGPAATSIATQLSGLKTLRPRYAHYAAFKNADQQTIDSGLLLYFAGPASFTGEDVIELQGHGGHVVMNLLLKEVLAHGALFITKNWTWFRPRRLPMSSAAAQNKRYWRHNGHCRALFLRTSTTFCSC